MMRHHVDGIQLFNFLVSQAIGHGPLLLAKGIPLGVKALLGKNNSSGLAMIEEFFLC